MNEKRATGGGLRELRSAESLELALRVARTFGYVPATISATIRSLMLDHVKGAQSHRSSILFHAHRIYRVPAVKASLYYLTTAFKREKLEGASQFTTEELIDWWSPDEISAIFGLIYLTRRAKALCDPDEWPGIFSMIQYHANLGIVVGNAIPRIGVASSLLVGALPCIALAAIQHKDKAGFKEYRRHLKGEGLALDHTFEYEKWGCDTIQVAASLSQMIGLGIHTADSLTHMLQTLYGEDHEVVLDALRLPVAYCWITGLSANGKPPEDLDVERLGELNPAAETSDNIVEMADQLRNPASEFRWLEKSKADISPDLTPKLPAVDVPISPSKRAGNAKPPPTDTPVQQQPGSVEAPSSDDELSYDKVLPELREMISEEEFNSMGLEERRQLIGDGTPQF